ncbi:MAG: branched-chain amino acid transport system substrate-binding protein [Micromonosporaceae bacterium]|nr:branched-chain amino acid transport system substrate-binding protein [Micromonosporaceae bacterium]
MGRTTALQSRMRAIACVAIAASLLAACGSNSDKANSGSGSGIDRSFVLGSIEPMSGANILTEYINGVCMAVKDINAAGGIGGKQVVLKEYDDGFDAQKSVAAARLAVADKVDAVIGASSSVENSAAAPILQRAGVIFLSAGMSSPVAKGEKNEHPLTFRIMPPMPELIYAEAQNIVNTVKPKSIGMMGINLTYGQNALPQFKKAFEDAGIKVTASNLYPSTTTDVTSEVMAMKGSEAVIDWSYPNQETLGLKAVGQHRLGDVPYFGGPSTSIINSRNAVPAELQKNLHGVQPCDPNTDSRQYVKDWAKRYKDTYNEIADYSSPSVYDAVHLLKAAVEKANSLEHTAIAKAIETTTLDQNTMCATTYRWTTVISSATRLW